MKPTILNPADKARFYTMCYGKGSPSAYYTPDKEYPIGSEYLDTITGQKWYKCTAGNNGWKKSSGGGGGEITHIDCGNANS